jgi:PAS domain-containing protein
MSSSKSIQFILARQLASCVAAPILLVDAEGTLVYYNEPAEVIFNQRFDETGELPAAEWTALIAAMDDDRNPLAPEDRPMFRAITKRYPVSQTIWIRRSDGEWRHLHVTAFPLVGERDVLLGAMSIFWEI